MFIQIGFWVLRLWKKDGGWTQQYAKRVGIILAVAVLLLVVLPVAKCSYDNHVIANHEQQVKLDAAKAENHADKQLAEDQKKHAAEQDRLSDAATAAALSDPTGAAKPVGPVTRSYYDNLPEKRR